VVDFLGFYEASHNRVPRTAEFLKV